MTSQEPIRLAAVAYDRGFAASQAIDKALRRSRDHEPVGRAESLGGGLLSSLALAVAAELPVLTAVRAL